MYSITVDHRRNLICATLDGFFSVEEVADFARAEQDAVRSLGCASDEYVVLVDAPGTIIQTQEVVTAFQRVIAEAPIKARRIAIVARGALYQIQTRRILTPGRSALFNDMNDAQEWLFTPDPT